MAALTELAQLAERFAGGIFGSAKATLVSSKTVQRVATSVANQSTKVAENLKGFSGTPAAEAETLEAVAPRRSWVQEKCTTAQFQQFQKDYPSLGRAFEAAANNPGKTALLGAGVLVGGRMLTSGEVTGPDGKTHHKHGVFRTVAEVAGVTLAVVGVASMLRSPKALENIGAALKDNKIPGQGELNL